MPILTVFTPAYNRAHTLPRTYESLKNQTCKDFIWLIVDDGSADNTRELVSLWMETEKDFEITCEGVKKYQITKLHAFPFSDHHIAERIPASSLPNQIPQEIRKQRNRTLISI